MPSTDFPKAPDQIDRASATKDRLFSLAPYYSQVPLLPHEQRAEFDELEAALFDAVNPRDRYEEILVHDIAQKTLEIVRINRSRERSLANSYRKELSFALRKNSALNVNAIDGLVADFFLNKNGAHISISQILSDANLTFDDILLRARSEISYPLEKFEIQLQNAEKSRQSVFLQIDQRRDAFARQLRMMSGFIEKNFIERNQGSQIAVIRNVSSSADAMLDEEKIKRPRTRKKLPNVDNNQTKFQFCDPKEGQ